MYKNRLKCALDEKQIEERLSHKPEILELHLMEDDLFGRRLKILTTTIEKLKSMRIKVYLHHPIKYNGVFTDILHEDKEIKAYYHLSTRILHRICLQYHVKCVLHCYSNESYCTRYQDQEHTLELKQGIEEILSWGGDVFLWENVIHGLFTFHNPYLFDVIVKPLSLPLVHDTSHTFIGVNGDNKKMLELTQKYHPYVKYLHVVDSLGESHDGLPLGEGKIDWKQLLPYFDEKPYIYEVLLDDYYDSTSMVRSAKYLENMMKEVDKK